MPKLFPNECMTASLVPLLGKGKRLHRMLESPGFWPCRASGSRAESALPTARRSRSGASGAKRFCNRYGGQATPRPNPVGAISSPRRSLSPIPLCATPPCDGRLKNTVSGCLEVGQRGDPIGGPGVPGIGFLLHNNGAATTDFRPGYGTVTSLHPDPVTAHFLPGGRPPSADRPGRSPVGSMSSP